jgi:hypothetical protein
LWGRGDSPGEDAPLRLAHSRCSEALAPSLDVCSPPPLPKEAVSWISVGRAQHWGFPPAITCQAARGRGPHLCGRLSAVPSPPGPGDPGPRAQQYAPSPARSPGQGDRYNPAVTQPRAARGALPLPSAGRRGHRVALGPRCGARLLVTLAGRPLHLLLLRPHTAAPSPRLQSRAPTPRRGPELLNGMRIPEPPRLGMRAPRQTRRGPGPRRPGGGRGGGDGKRKRWAAPSRSRTWEELPAVGAAAFAGAQWPAGVCVQPMGRL